MKQNRNKNLRAPKKWNIENEAKTKKSLSLAGKTLIGKEKKSSMKNKIGNIQKTAQKQNNHQKYVGACYILSLFSGEDL